MKKWLVVSLLIVCKFSFAQNKIGIVDTLFLLEELPSRDSTLEMIEAKKTAYAVESAKMDSVYFSKKEFYNAHKSDWSSLVVQIQEKQIAELKTKIIESNKQSDMEIKRLTKECDERSLKIMHEAIDKVSSDLKLNAVWDKSKALDSSDEIDITDKVHAEMLRIDHP